MLVVNHYMLGTMTSSFTLSLNDSDVIEAILKKAIFVLKIKQ